MKRYINSDSDSTTKYYAVLDTKFVGLHKVKLDAKNDAEAKAEVKKLVNSWNTLVKIVRVK